MTWAHGTVLLVATVVPLALAIPALWRASRRLLHWGFALGMVGFGLESLVTYALVTRTDTADERLLYLEALEVAAVALLVPWALFVASLTGARGIKTSHVARAILVAGGLVTVASAAATLGLPTFQVADITGTFYAARIDLAARLTVIVQIVGTIGILAGLEAALRLSRADTRWRVKFLVLGLGGIFLARFYFLGQILLFNVIMAAYLTTQAATLVVGSLVVAGSLVRDRLGVELTVSRHVVYRSVVVGVLGCYLLVLGVLGWLVRQLDIPGELFWGSLLVFVSALGLAAIMLSDNLRWRIKRLIGVHFYRSKYDYREQWRSFTKRLGSLLTLEDLAPQLLGAVMDAMGTARGVLYVADGRGGRFHVASTIGLDERPPDSLHADTELIASFVADPAPFLLDRGRGDPIESWLRHNMKDLFSDGGVVVPLQWRGELTGLMLVGPERTGILYETEDLEFLATVGEQAAGIIATAHLSETLAQSREFDAFNRLTSFVVHDLKNSISALSMLSDNALKNFDDPEFQRDALKTLARTVDRMKALLGKLSSAPEAARLRFEPVDLVALALDAATPIVKSDRITFVKELRPLPPVLADAEALTRVLQNLITNAIEAVEGEGTITLSTYEQGGTAIVAVTDTGCGMSEEFIRKLLFTPFRSTKKGGWGIGLHQARGIAEAHGGVIEVASKEGSGTTMAIKLPIGGPRRP